MQENNSSGAQPTESTQCRYFPDCKGCDYLHLDYNQQVDFKKQDLIRHFKTSEIDLTTEEIQFTTVGQKKLRHRFDFTIESKQHSPSDKISKQLKGLYGKTTSNEKHLVDLEHCLQLDDSLQQFFSEFRTIDLEYGNHLIQKGSVRLRISPDGKKGCWLDLANQDIKNLLLDQTYLQKLLDKNIQIEIGQKGKKLVRVNETLKLSEPEFQAWFQTIDSKGNFIPLKCLISDFTQPSWTSANKIVEIILKWLSKYSFTNVLEFGPGIGQFSLPILSLGTKLYSYDNNPKAIQALQINSLENNLHQNLKTFLGDFQKSSLQLFENSSGKFDVALVNPARSGLKNFVTELIQANTQAIIYVSCYPESMAIDTKLILNAGFKIKEINLVDQFPQTKHYETCLLLERKNK